MGTEYPLPVALEMQPFEALPTFQLQGGKGAKDFERGCDHMGSGYTLSRKSCGFEHDASSVSILVSTYFPAK